MKKLIVIAALAVTSIASLAFTGPAKGVATQVCQSCAPPRAKCFTHSACCSGTCMFMGDRLGLCR